MTESPEDLAAVEQLLVESESLRGWLTRLEQAPGAVPDAVRDRVRGDYQRRLDQLTAGLRAHEDVVNSRLADDRAEHADLTGRSTAAREALAEAELRHAVGEYDDDKINGERKRYSSDIETFEVSLGAIGARIAKLEQIHSMMRVKPAAPAAQPAAQPAMHEGVRPDAPAPVETATSEAVPISQLAPEKESGFAMFADLSLDPSAAGLADLERSGDSPLTDNGPLSFRPTGSPADFHRTTPPAAPAAPSARPEPFTSAPPLSIPTAADSPRFVRPGDRLGGNPAPPVMAPTADAAVAAPAKPAAPPAAPTASTTAGDGGSATAGRTLRCGECGAMNRPLEWYCEKCGAELTAV